MAARCGLNLQVRLGAYAIMADNRRIPFTVFSRRDDPCDRPWAGIVPAPGQTQGLPLWGTQGDALG